VDRGDVLILALLVLLSSGQFPSNLADVPQTAVCKGVPADPARPGLWECPRLGKDSVRVLLRAESLPKGEVRFLEWSAERKLAPVHLPEETFWKILDHFAGDGEWAERDVKAIGKDTALFPASVGQLFECVRCPAPLIAGTWGPRGSARLVMARRSQASPVAAALALQSVTYVSRLSLPPLTSKPCREKGGDCEEVRSGPGDARWTFRRTHPDSAWETVRIEWQAGAFGDSLSVKALKEDMPPKDVEFLLSNWLSAESDLFAANAIAPGEAFLTATSADWRTRNLPGFRLNAILARILATGEVPKSVTIYQDSHGRAGIAGRLRWMEITRSK